MRDRWRVSLWTLPLAACCLASLLLYFLIKAPLPNEQGSRELEGLRAQVTIDFDELGIPRISASSAADAFQALGFVTAGDRLFQMDLLRRRAAGRLAEIFGRDALQEDRWNRTMGFDQLAATIVSRLPATQRQLLDAYSAGVNQAMAAAAMLPFEFTLLGYRPEPWRPEDSILVMLGMHALLSWSADQERTATVMRQALPGSVVAFLTPESDCYNEKLTPHNPARCTGGAVPITDLIGVMNLARVPANEGEDIVSGSSRQKGSNAWVVGRAKTRDGRAILANDMHLDLAVPNIWYRAELHYPGAVLSGLTLAGLPLLIAGSNGRVAWGLTSVEGDFSDLVSIEEDSNWKNRYLTPAGFLPFETRSEIIRVRGSAAETLQVRTTIWGPVLAEPLLGRPVAVHWTALDPASTDLGISDIAGVTTVAAAIALVHRAGGPPVNVLLADDSGNIAWTFMGRLPRRFGMDGLFSESWADGKKGWDGYIPPDDVPTIVNPPDGYIVSANHRMLGGDYPTAIGHDFAGGYRAWRIAELLKPLGRSSERDMLALQLDTRTDFYRYYQQLGLHALEGGGLTGQFSNVELRHYLEAWDGQAETSSLGLALLVQFRNDLVKAVLEPVLASCREIDPSFRFSWHNVDVPVRQIIDSGRTELLPDQQRFQDWDSFLRAVLVRSAQKLVERHGAKTLAEIRWGDESEVDMHHPLSRSNWFFAWLLDMPRVPLSGCTHCVRVASGKHGATERMVVAPGHESDGILHMPGGQSGQPGSRHYDDQQQGWIAGRATKFSPGAAVHRLNLRPRA
jgi:penicillin G amidase